MVDDAKDPSQQPLLGDIAPSSQRTDPPTAVRIPSDPKADARKSVDTLFGMSVQSGPAATINAFALLPEAIQAKQLDNDSESLKRSFALEEAQLAAEERDRAAQRKHELDRRTIEIARDEKVENRHYWLTVFIIIVVCGICLFLFGKERYDVAVPMATGLLGLGAGFTGGQSQGYKSARREMARPESSKLDK